MKSTIASNLALLLAAMVGAAQAAPAAEPSTSDWKPPSSLNPNLKVVRKLSGRGINDCDDSTFVNRSSDGSPLIVDCQHLVDNISGDGSWRVTTSGGQRQIAQYGTCAFGATAYNDWYAYIGNDDVRDLITDSIRRFSWNGKVGAEGDMMCDGGIGGSGGRAIHVNWGLYHT